MSGPGDQIRDRMDRVYRWQRHIYDATRWSFLIGRNRVIVGLSVPAEGTVLEIGCGTARNLIAIARRYPRAALYGIDVSPLMLATAERAVDRAGLADRIRLAAGNAATADPGRLLGVASFDRVVISYALSMIPDWEVALDRALAALAPKGELWIVDFGAQAGWPAWLRTAHRSFLARFHVKPCDALGAALAAKAPRDRFEVAREDLVFGLAHLAILRRRA